MDTTFERLIHLYLEGRLDAASEELLFRELSQNADLRQEMTAQVRLHGVTKRDAARILPTERDKAAIFGRLGLAGGAATLATATPSTAQILSLPGFFRTKQILRYAATILVTAVLTWWLLRFGNGNGTGSGIESRAEYAFAQTNSTQTVVTPVEMTMLVPIEKRVERVVVKEIEKQVVNRVETRYKTITRYIQQNGDTSEAASFLAAQATSQKALIPAFSQPSAREKGQERETRTSSEPSPRASRERGSLVERGEGNSAIALEAAPILVFEQALATPPQSLLLDSIDKLLFPALPKRKEFIPTAFLSLRVAADLGGMREAWQFKPFNMAGLSVGYNWTQNGILGLEASLDAIALQNEQGTSVASPPIASVFYRHVLNDWTIEIPQESLAFLGERITPFAQVSLGSSGVPIALRGMIGATFYGISLDKRRWSNSLGIEITQLLSGQERYIPKVALSFSQNLNL
ncbi:MAG: hypothetical protein EAZ92_14585 [Candidatus Kapaibacterium sp.]|nr:MAG: hypothetical protein EAZ92_14585 [Candidatus Kapabacteria bacterium]